jgi:fumarate hydratase class II
MAATESEDPTSRDEEPLRIHDVPIGLAVGGTRTETDSMGEIAVPADRYWGAQT